MPTPPPGGPDLQSPVVQLFPGSDTTVDSTGVLLVRVVADDRSALRRVEFSLAPAAFGFPDAHPGDTTFEAFYNIPLSVYRHSSFSYTVRVIDVLDNQTDTAVTVTVR